MPETAVQEQATPTQTPATPEPTSKETTARWTDTLTDESLKGSKSLAKFKTAEDLAKSYIALEGRLGGSVAIPGKDAKPEEVEAFLDRLGRPKSEVDYELTPPEKMPEGIEYNDEMEADFRLAAHKAGLTQTQAQGLYDWYMQAAAGRLAEAPKGLTRAQAVAALKKEWGTDYQKNAAITDRYVKEHVSDEAYERFKAAGLLYDPATAKLFLAAGLKTLDLGEEIAGNPATTSAPTGRVVDGTATFEYPNTKT